MGNRAIISGLIIVSFVVVGYAGWHMILPHHAIITSQLGNPSGVPERMNHQGVVTVGGVRFTGTGYFKFAVVDGNGTNLWTNDGTRLNEIGVAPDSAVQLTVTDGIYSVVLGDTSLPNMTQPLPASLFSNDGLRLRIWFDDGTHGFARLMPDHHLTSVPYALSAGRVAGNAGVWTQNGNDIHYSTGNVGIGTATPSALLHLSRDGDADMRFQVKNVPGGGGVVGSGPNPPASAVNDSAIGTIAWTNAVNVGVQDGHYATATGNGTTHYLKVSNLGFNLPSNRTITGIEVFVRRKGTQTISPGNVTFNFTGAQQTWVVPAGVTSINVDARGASGGNGTAGQVSGGAGGLGGRVQATLSVTPGETLYVYVGGQGGTGSGLSGGVGGFNGGGNGGGAVGGDGGGGGGASDIRRGGTALTNRIIVAAGGGGGGGGGGGSPGTAGGHGGGASGTAGGNTSEGAQGGQGGTQSGGGAGGNGAQSGTAGQGGQGLNGDGGGTDAGGGGGGGGGLFGGGGGGRASNRSGAGGGGGSSLLAGGSTTAGFQSGHGQILISYNVDIRVTDHRVSLVRGGTVTATNKATSASWSATDETASYGGSTDLWAQSWTPADINDPGFGVVVAANLVGGATASIDQITIKVYSLGPGDVDWTMGGDQSDLGKFKISRGHALGVNDLLIIDSAGNLTISGKLNAPGGVDPPYVSFSRQTRESIRQYARDIDAHHEEAMLFWNARTRRLEVFAVSENIFYTLDGQVIEE